MIFGACLTVIYFLAPLRVGQGGFVNDRILLALWAVLLPVLGTGLRKRSRVAILALIALLLGWQAITYSLRSRRFGEQYWALMEQAATIPEGSVVRYVQPYEASHFEHSFVAPFMDGGEIAYHCRCVLVEDSWKGAPFYWVAIHEANRRPPDYDVWLSPGDSGGAAQLNRSPVSRAGLSLRVLRVERSPDAGKPPAP
jgi:hypothetical protein